MYTWVQPLSFATPSPGSSDLWVWSSFLHTTSKNLQGHTVYNPNKSSTAKVASGLTWNIRYGDGSSASTDHLLLYCVVVWKLTCMGVTGGNVYTDTIKLDTLSIPGQAVEVATKLSSSFLSSKGSDGLLGLAFPTYEFSTHTPGVGLPSSICAPAFALI